MPTAQEPPRWLDDTEMAAWLAYIETQWDLLGALEADLSPTGLSLGDYQVLVYLSATATQSMKMSDLAQVLQVSPSGLTRRLDGLVRNGLVDRQPSERDRRVMHATLTTAGRATLDAAAPIHLASARKRLIDHLDRDELATIARVFSKVRAALNADRDGTATS